MSNIVKGIRYYRQGILTRLAITLFGENHIERDDLFTYEGKVYKGIFYYTKKHQESD